MKKAADTTSLRARDSSSRMAKLVIGNAHPGTKPSPARRHIEKRARKTRIDYVEVVRTLSHKSFPNAERIILVQDNLNTHSPVSLYEAFARAEARRLIERFEFHFTPKHGNWLDIAELERKRAKPRLPGSPHSRSSYSGPRTSLLEGR